MRIHEFSGDGLHDLAGEFVMSLIVRTHPDRRFNSDEAKGSLLPSTIEVRDLDPFSLDMIRDPYPAYEAIREAGPVVRLERYGTWASARYGAIRSILLDSPSFCSGAGTGFTNLNEEKGWRPPSPLLEADPPEHSRTRRVVAGVLSAAAVQRLEETAAAVADEMVAQLPQDEPFDAMADLARAFPTRVFADAVGLPTQGRENLHPYARVVFNAKGPRERADGLGSTLFQEAMAQAGASREWVEQYCRAENLAADGLGAQIHERAAAEGFSSDVGGLLVRSFLSAGIDTTVYALGNALWCLAGHPDQYAAMCSQPDGSRAAFEETLRFESADQWIFRTTAREVELDGVALGEGEKVMLLLAGANRDPRQWTDPDVYDVTRRSTGHLTFGYGIHACLGMAFARMEGQAVLSALARRARRIVPAGQPRRALVNSLRGFETLPLRLIAG
ncbi:cytochrome P450 [Pseudonocardia alaniniphila]|uniref:Cytochrome P450 n=1 Tax=Pseudonocardia alaniniphila TaxID=75291 RepID=A0ABS9TSE3_9PSEU|nr:cytochrome P450 [Pseudonocardia alaniniphila]MCH6171477.1 cytochrome P450 [Pseudonocardia alaniniphila]